MHVPAATSYPFKPGVDLSLNTVVLVRPRLSDGDLKI